MIAKWDKITNHGHRRYDQCLGAPFLLYGEGTGRMYTCGMFFDGKYEQDYRLGDLKTQSLEEIVFSDHYWAVVAKVRDQINVHKECYANCRTSSQRLPLGTPSWPAGSPPQSARTTPAAMLPARLPRM